MLGLYVPSPFTSQSNASPEVNVPLVPKLPYVIVLVPFEPLVVYPVPLQ